ncbi:sulfotransferase family 2 domain-containing protein [Bacillus sp. JJ1562]|uniref:sulfotransferase family 2 domain-containing protein n=1 Tax=Bacillus sp. JJ1562 TaxID=3122960 RepID=UPI003000FF62
MSEQQYEELEVIYGHCRFGIHKEFTGSYKYITMLRDPIERIISTYYFAKRRPQNRMYESANTYDFKEFIEWELSQNNPAFENHQTRFVSGEKKPDLEKAIENIHESYSVVGIMEMFDESIFLMKEYLDWEDISYEKENVTSNWPKQADLPQNTIALIAEKNQLDLELYQYAKKLLVENINQLPRRTKKALEEYKRNNRKDRK